MSKAPRAFLITSHLASSESWGSQHDFVAVKKGTKGFHRDPGVMCLDTDADRARLLLATEVQAGRVKFIDGINTTHSDFYDVKSKQGKIVMENFIPKVDSPGILHLLARQPNCGDPARGLHYQTCVDLLYERSKKFHATTTQPEYVLAALSVQHQARALYCMGVRFYGMSKSQRKSLERLYDNTIKFNRDQNSKLLNPLCFPGRLPSAHFGQEQYKKYIETTKYQNATPHQVKGTDLVVTSPFYCGYFNRKPVKYQQHDAMMNTDEHKADFILTRHTRTRKNIRDKDEMVEMFCKMHDKKILFQRTWGHTTNAAVSERRRAAFKKHVDDAKFEVRELVEMIAKLPIKREFSVRCGKLTPSSVASLHPKAYITTDGRFYSEPPQLGLNDTPLFFEAKARREPATTEEERIKDEDKRMRSYRNYRQTHAAAVHEYTFQHHESKTFGLDGTENGHSSAESSEGEDADPDLEMVARRVAWRARRLKRHTDSIQFTTYLSESDLEKDEAKYSSESDDHSSDSEGDLNIRRLNRITIANNRNVEKTRQDAIIGTVVKALTKIENDLRFPLGNSETSSSEEEEGEEEHNDSDEVAGYISAWARLTPPKNDDSINEREQIIAEMYEKERREEQEREADVSQHEEESQFVIDSSNDSLRKEQNYEEDMDITLGGGGEAGNDDSTVPDDSDCETIDSPAPSSIFKGTPVSNITVDESNLHAIKPHGMSGRNLPEEFDSYDENSNSPIVRDTQDDEGRGKRKRVAKEQELSQSTSQKNAKARAGVLRTRATRGMSDTFTFDDDDSGDD